MRSSYVQQPLPFGKNMEAQKREERTKKVLSLVSDKEVFKFGEPRSDGEKEIQDAVRKTISEITMVDSFEEATYKDAVMFREEIEDALGERGFAANYDAGNQRVQITVATSNPNDGSHDSGR